MNIEKLLQLSLKVKGEGSLHSVHARGLLAHLAAIKETGFEDFDFYPEGVEQPSEGVLRFTPETRVCLEAMGYEIYEIKANESRASYLDLMIEKRGSKIKAEEPPCDREVAIKWKSPFLGTSNLSRLDQEDLIEEYQRELKEKVWGVRAILPDAFVAEALGSRFSMRHLEKRDLVEWNLFPIGMREGKPFYVATTTRVDGSSFVAVGRRYWGQMDSEWVADDGKLPNVHVMPVVVPSVAPLFDAAP